MNVSSDRRIMRVIGSAAMESFVQQLSSAVPSFEFQFVPAGTASLESQQMDEAEREAMMADLKAQLERSLNGERPTGALQLFLLSGGGMADGDAESQATLRALAHAALNDPSNTVAALLPEDVKTPDDMPSQLPAAVRSVVEEFLGTTKVPVFQDPTQLTQHLTSL